MLASFPAERSEVDRRGLEPRFPGCKPRVLPLDEQPICFLQEVRPGFEPDPRPYHGRVLPRHLQTVSDYRGPSLLPPFRSAAGPCFPDGVEPSCPACRAGVVTVGPRNQVVSDQDGNRTHRITRLSTSPLFQFAYSVVSNNKWRVRESHPTVKAYEASMGTGPPAMIVCRLKVAGTGSQESVPVVPSF